MSCPTHSTRPRLIEAARPPGEQAQVQQQQTQLASGLEPIHGAILAGIVGSGASMLIPLTSVGAIRRHVSMRFDRHGGQFNSQFTELVNQGAEMGRATAVRRYGLDVSPTFGDEQGGSAADLPPNNAGRQDLDRIARRARQQVTDRMTRDISQAIYDASEAGLSREEIATRLRENRFEQARTTEARLIAETELPASANRGALAAYEDSDNTEKRWVGILDSRIRRSHREAHGQVVPVDQPFVVNGFEAQYPGDPTLPISERARCRCFPAPN